jgi:hypothetical protein
MFRRMLFATIIFFSLLFVAVYYSKDRTVPKSKLSDSSKIIQQTMLKELPELDYPILNETNEKNELIDSFFCKNIDIKVWENGRRLNLSGQISYKKPNYFLFEISSILGKEMNLGSNEKEFWYYSKRDKDPGVYWAVYEDFNKTRLKTPFNPMFMRASLGFESVVAKDSKITESATQIIVTNISEDSMGKQILYSVFFNKNKHIDGFLITDLQGNTLVSCDIQERANGMPSKILYTWEEEKRVMFMELKKAAVNTIKETSMFKMPRFTPKINMAEE